MNVRPAAFSEISGVATLAVSEARRRRVLALVQLPPPEHGAAAVNRQIVQSERIAQAFDVDVVPISMIDDLARIRRFEWNKIARSMKLFGSVAGRMFGRARPDLVYFTLSPNGWAFYRDLALVGLFRVARLPHVLHLHGRGVAKAIHHASWKRALYRFAFGRAFVITLGGSLQRDVAGVARPNRVFVVPNGVRDVAAELTADRSSGPPAILFLSNMLEEKGPLILLEALALLERRGVLFQAKFAGAWRGPMSPDRFASSVASLGLEGRVAHLGPIYGAEKTRVFAAADLFVLPTYYSHEALPLVVIEAMMHGIPVVATNVGALPEIVLHRQTGELVEPKDVAALADALERLVTDADLRAAYGRAGRKKYETDLTEARFEERLIRVLSKAMERA